MVIAADKEQKAKEERENDSRTLNITQYVRYWTIGWNKHGRLVPIPVICRKQKIGNDYAFVAESAEEAAVGRECTLVLTDDIFEMDQWGHNLHVHPLWHIIDHKIKATDSEGANEAILEVMQYLLKMK